MLAHVFEFFNIICSSLQFLRNCNCRYAFTPLLDRDEDYSSEEEEDDILYSDAWEGLKMRGRASYRSDSPDEGTIWYLMSINLSECSVNKNNSYVRAGADPELDPLKWVEENIPDVDGALPIIDSEEEIETTKTEISKLHWSMIVYYCLIKLQLFIIKSFK